VATGEQAAGDTGSSPRAAARAELEKRHAQIEDLESRLSTIEAERSELETDLEAEREERSRLESEVSDLEAERDRLSSRVAELEAALEDSGAKPGAETTTLTPAEALAGTNLFVRYGSKGEPTLEALGSDVDPAAVNANLRLEHHTQFETKTVQVDGRTFRDFLEDTGEFRFVSWVLRELPYELLETGNRNALGDLFEAVSAIDRIEFDGSVTVDPESGTDRTFALVMRDRMGNPLIVGEYNDGRSPVRDGELETLLDGARDVAGAADSLAGAFYVTASFFEPGALERAENAASTGGLFSRQDKASFVTPDSGTGFHLGLIEDRSQAFHVTVPKL
jgi:chaperonin cofactor prefoldin